MVHVGMFRYKRVQVCKYLFSGVACREVLQVLVCVAAASARLSRGNTANHQRAMQHILEVRAPVARREQSRIVPLADERCRSAACLSSRPTLTSTMARLSLSVPGSACRLARRFYPGPRRVPRFSRCTPCHCCALRRDASRAGQRVPAAPRLLGLGPFCERTNIFIS